MRHETRGGFIAHIARRIFHGLMLIIPFVYYYLLVPIAKAKILQLGILAFIFFVFLFEKLRIRMRLVLFGQRLHEATHISAFAWTMLALGVLLLLSPSKGYSIAIVATCALIDPWLGEMRIHHVNSKIVLFIGILSTFLIWMLCSYVYHFPQWIAIIMAPIAVFSERPNLKWIDDNAMMILIPLLVILILKAIHLA